jgi:hypothetical protein
MTPIRDQYNDPSYTMLFHLLEHRTEVADFVKHAEMDSSMADQLPATAFAWPERRLLPINSAENTVLSSLYREKIAAVPAEVDELLKTAQTVYGVKDLLARSQEQEKNAQEAVPAEEPVYMLPRLGRLRVKTAEDVTVAEGLLLEQYPRLSIEDRAEGFINLVKTARDKGVKLQPKTHQMAGMTVCTTKVAMDFIEARRCATKVPLFQQAYEKLAASFRGKGEFMQDRDELVKVADALARIDTMADIRHRYDKSLPDPIQTVFNTTKLAEEMVNISGRSIPMSKLAAMPLTFWEDVVGPDLAQEVSDGSGGVDAMKLGQIVPTLPLDLQIILKNQIP